MIRTMPRRSRTLRVVVIGSALLAMAAAETFAGQVDALVARAAAATADERTRLGTLLADETYIQTAESSKSLGGSNFGIGGAGMPVMEQHTTRTKRMVLSTWLATAGPDAAAQWAVVREPREIDGKPAEGDARLQALAVTPGPLAKAWTELETAGEAQHLGPLPRRVVNPWLAVDLVGEATRSRLSFKIDGDERLAGTPTTRLGFAERPGPAALQDREIAWARVRGTLWVDAEGRTRRSRLELADSAGVRRARVDVEFALDPALGAVVPQEVRERHDFADGKVEARATYRNVRRLPGPP
jgi:hypothetical protein